MSDSPRQKYEMAQEIQSLRREIKGLEREIKRLEQDLALESARYQAGILESARRQAAIDAAYQKGRDDGYWDATPQSRPAQEYDDLSQPSHEKQLPTKASGSSQLKKQRN